MYPTPLHRIPGLQGYFPASCYPNAESIAERVLTLPLHEMVTSRDIRRICSIIRAA